ncbi:phage tail protein [Porphyrobacter sp. ULC335]|uniref:phage tail protein n=1 Tax=Porphyrobacter sp. ULC335 TaxID=2854260 RepID=UPI002220ED67|nr:phage tail protein [Porphyrobacter sp. ULC335]UYV16118.1 phage tail protein [Porphyrobacter sp. ULC335]
MATLILTAVGSAFGGPIGGTIGALIGQQIDSRIFGPSGREGPRLKELTISTSSYGQPIPRQFGRMRVAGTVIWSTDLIESKRKEKGRKGQPSTTVYAYSASFAVALSSTPINRVGRIWADGNLLRGAQDDLKVGGTLRIYRGFGDDPVDPLIAAAKGESAPAFRDCAYVVFENLELGDYGNRIPALSFEIFADGGDDTVSLAQLVPDGTAIPAAPPLAQTRGFADEGGPLASTLAAIDQVIPLVCMSGNDGLTVAVRGVPDSEIMTLPDKLAVIADEPDAARHKQRSGIPVRSPAALRYYDEERDYQTGVQRATGARRAGRELMIDLPATLTASGARQLANDGANRARWQHEAVTWRIGELDPRITPGTIVRLPDTPGHWLLRSWEWLDRGIALELERLAPAGGAPRVSDPGENLPPTDLLVPPTRLAAIEVPPEANANPAQPLIFAAASAANTAWRGAALFAVQGSALIDLGTTGTRRAVMGVLVAPLEGSKALLFEPKAEAVVELVAADLDLPETDIAGLAAGANKLMIGGELVQFLHAEPEGSGRWRLRGLLRGRGGTEPAAALGHAAGAQALLLDDSLVPLDPLLVPPLASSRVAALGTGDVETVIAPLANAGLSRRPPCPVHPRITRAADGVSTYRWTRRARGHWRWDDAVEVPLIEEREAYLVGFGPADAPHVAWQSDEPLLRLTSSEHASLIAAYGPGALWVRQVGTFDRSSPLLLASLF